MVNCRVKKMNKLRVLCFRRSSNRLTIVSIIKPLIDHYVYQYQHYWPLIVGIKCDLIRITPHEQTISHPHTSTMLRTDTTSHPRDNSFNWGKQFHGYGYTNVGSLFKGRKQQFNLGVFHDIVSHLVLVFVQHNGSPVAGISFPQTNLSISFQTVSTTDQHTHTHTNNYHYQSLLVTDLLDDTNHGYAKALCRFMGHLPFASTSCGQAFSVSTWQPPFVRSPPCVCVFVSGMGNQLHPTMVRYG